MGTGNPNPRKIAREQEGLDKHMESFRLILLNLSWRVPNGNFYPNSAAKEAIKAIDEANKETRLIFRRNRLRELRRLEVGHPDRVFWHKTGDGREDAQNKEPLPRHLSLAGRKKKRFVYV